MFVCLYNIADTLPIIEYIVKVYDKTKQMLMVENNIDLVASERGDFDMVVSSEAKWSITNLQLRGN